MAASAEEPRAVPSGRRPAGRVAVPASKSLTHRFLDLALLSRRPTTLLRPLLAEDTRLFLGALAACGWTVDEAPGEEVRLTPRAAQSEQQVEIFCGNCGTMLRLLTAALCVLPGRFRLDGVERLRERPVGPLVEALRRLGAEIEYASRPGFAPLRIGGARLRGGATVLDAGQSSQYLSGLLLAALAAPAPVEVEVEALSSAPYVDVTLQAAELFGGRIEDIGGQGAGLDRARPGPLHLPGSADARHLEPADRGAASAHDGSPGAGRARRLYRVTPGPLGAPRVAVEGDASAACYAGAAAALCRGEVTLAGLPPDSRQGDLRFFALLRAMGAEVDWRGGELAVRGAAEGLRAIDADLADLPDQVPTLAALAPFARGATRIRNVAHLRLKESDRLAAMAEELRRVGAVVEEGADSLIIPGIWAQAAPPGDPVVVDPHGDHRIAMSLALTALRRPGIAISSPGVVAKSYPEFWQDLDRLLAIAG
jgi:3-phosphoshikimate 1-carboxyvinyltransferase